MISTDAASTNLALLKPAYQSSTFDNKYNASLAVDGYADPVFENMHCSHTNDQSGGPHWLCVDLGSPYRIKNVILTNRNNNGKYEFHCRWSYRYIICRK